MSNSNGELPEDFKAAFTEMARTIESAFASASDEPTKVRFAYKVALNAAADFCEKLGAPAREVEARISALLYMLNDLDKGVVHPVLAPAKNMAGGAPQDSTFVWQARAMVARGIECLIRAGFTELEAVEIAATEYEQCDRLLRKGGNLSTSMARWRRLFTTKRCPNAAAQAGYEAVTQFSEVAADAPRAEMEAEGRACLSLAAEIAASLPAGPEPDWLKEEMDL